MFSSSMHGRQTGAGRPETTDRRRMTSPHASKLPSIAKMCRLKSCVPLLLLEKACKLSLASCTLSIRFLHGSMYAWRQDVRPSLIIRRLMRLFHRPSPKVQTSHQCVRACMHAHASVESMAFFETLTHSLLAVANLGFDGRVVQQGKKKIPQ